MTAAVSAIHRWLNEGTADADGFPYLLVVDAYQQVGKHFVGADLHVALASVRNQQLLVSGGDEARRRLTRFLDVALDKYDGRYDYRSYLALPLLPTPSLDHPPHPAEALAARDRLLVHLLTDLIRFELAAAAHTTDLLPRMRPDARVVDKRCRLALRAALPALRRLRLVDAMPTRDSTDAVRQAWTAVDDALTPKQRLDLLTSLLPVATIHDEYLFIRVLQSFETTFALLALDVQAVAGLLATGHGMTAASLLLSAASILRECAPLWSLMATMQPESFRDFRQFTEGASAIQSRHYKLMESLARRPDAERLDSPAFTSVPDVRERVLAGHPTVDDAYEAAAAAGGLSPDEDDDMQRAMASFAAAVEQWRRTHYRLAVRMLGRQQTGTGYTEGVPYLEQARTAEVFRHGRSP